MYVCMCVYICAFACMCMAYVSVWHMYVCVHVCMYKNERNGGIGFGRKVYCAYIHWIHTYICSTMSVVLH